MLYKTIVCAVLLNYVSNSWNAIPGHLLDAFVGDAKRPWRQPRAGG